MAALPAAATFAAAPSANATLENGNPSNGGLRQAKDPQESANSEMIEREILVLPNAANIKPNAAITLETLGNAGVDFSNCSKEQCEYILCYANGIVSDGYKPEFAERICKFMAILYRNGIDSKEYIPEWSGNLDVVFSKENADIRHNCLVELAKIVNTNGGRYPIVRSWLRRQQDGSWTESPRALKSYLFNQRTNQSEIEKRYFLQKNTVSSLSLTLEEVLGNSGEVQEGQTTEVTEEIYANSVAAYRAFTAIALNSKISASNPFVHQLAKTCTLIRTDGGNMKRDYPSEEWEKDGMISAAVKGGIADSTAMVGLEGAYPGELVRQFEVPFWRISAVFYASQELSASCKSEREVVCDFSGLESIVLRT
ncbi:MAG: hypothetical protein LBI56_04235 [Puniceicoccales bacterium]|nr:hypothetical protein [Puniceicoccales bacterium]